jgi:hypothetical protein
MRSRTSGPTAAARCRQAGPSRGGERGRGPGRATLAVGRGCRAQQIENAGLVDDPERIAPTLPDLRDFVDRRARELPRGGAGREVQPRAVRIQHTFGPERATLVGGPVRPAVGRRGTAACSDPSRTIFVVSSKSGTTSSPTSSSTTSGLRDPRVRGRAGERRRDHRPWLSLEEARTGGCGGFSRGSAVGGRYRRLELRAVLAAFRAWTSTSPWRAPDDG